MCATVCRSHPLHQDGALAELLPFLAIPSRGRLPLSVELPLYVAIPHPPQVCQNWNGLPRRCHCSTCSVVQRSKELEATQKSASLCQCDRRLPRSLSHPHRRLNLPCDRIPHHPPNRQYEPAPVKYSDPCQCDRHHKRRSLGLGSRHRCSRLSHSLSNMLLYKHVYLLRRS
jgi:hypothetical protein